MQSGAFCDVVVFVSCPSTVGTKTGWEHCRSIYRCSIEFQTSCENQRTISFPSQPTHFFGWSCQCYRQPMLR